MGFLFFVGIIAAILYFSAKSNKAARLHELRTRMAGCSDELLLRGA